MLVHKYSLLKRHTLVCFLFNLFVIVACAYGEQSDTGRSSQLFDMDIEDLTAMSYTVYGASKYEQKMAEAPSSISIITADEIRKYGYRTLADILRSTRGLYTTYDRNYQYLGVRGFGRPGDYDSRILLLVDGRKANDNVFDTAYIDGTFILDVDLIDRVEIIRGPGSSLYGSNAFFAIINVITKSGRQFNGTELSGELASYDTYKGRATYGSKLDNGLEMLVSATNYDSDGQRLYYREFDDPSTNNGIAENADAENYGNVFAKLALGDVTFEAARGSRTKRIPTASFGTVFNDNRTKTCDGLGLLDLNYEHNFEEVVRFMGRLFYGFYDYDGDYVFPGPYINKDYANGEWMGAEVQFTKKLFEKHRIVWGAEYQNDRKQQQGNYDIYGVYLDDNRRSERWGIFVQDEFRILDGTILNLGVRHDDYSSFGGTTNPRLGLIQNVFDKTTVKLLYGKAFRAPSPYELYYNDGGVTQNANPNLEPETITTYELVVEQALGKSWLASASAFIYEIANLITLGPDPTNPSLSRYDNAETIKAKGLEFELDGKWKTGWRSRFSYSFVNAKDETTGETLTNSPRHLGKANLIVPLMEEKLFAGLEAQYNSKVLTLAGNHTDDFIVANLTLTYVNLIKGLDVSGGVYNLFDKEYGNPGFSEHTQDIINQDGINYRIKLTYRF